MQFDSHPNLAAGTLLTPPNPALSGTTFQLYPGDGSAFEPNMPVTLAPPDVQPDRDNAEIGYVTEVEGDTLTIQRAQEGTAPLPVQAGWRVYGTATRKTFEDIEAAISGMSGSSLIFTTPNEAPNGVRATFTTPSAYFPGSLGVWLNGIKEGFVTEATTSSFTFEDAPKVGDTIQLMYNSN
jgi:hypothetical protein